MPGVTEPGPTWSRWVVVTALAVAIAAGRAGDWIPAPGQAMVRSVPPSSRLGAEGRTPVATGVSAPPVQAAAALVMDSLTGTVLFDLNARTPRPPASTTKVLTALLALERGNLDAEVEVSPRAARTEGSSMYLRAGDRYRLRELLYGLLLNSGNDAAVAIAEHLAGSVEQFAQWMNVRARELGATQSHFINPNGLHHPSHYSSAYDLALITRAAFRHPEFAAIVRQRDIALPRSLSEGTLRLHNTNRLLSLFEGADGVKTGTTSAAGACLIASATRTDGDLGTPQQMIAIVLDADSRWRDAMRLLEWGYQEFQLRRMLDPGEVLTRLTVTGGQEPTVAVAVAGPMAAVLRRNTSPEMQMEWQLPAAVPAPVPMGTSVGSAQLKADGRVVAEVPLVTAAAVPVASWSTRLLRPWVGWLEWLGRTGVLD